MWNFFNQHEVLGFFAICSVFYTVYNITFLLPNRVLRCINMWKNGYPPEHCDGDGEFAKGVDDEDE